MNRTVADCTARLDDALLDRIKLLRGVDRAACRTLLAQCPIHELGTGERLLEAGSENRSLFLVLAGEFEVHAIPGDPTPVAVLGVGDSVGELSLIDEQPTSAAVIAASPARVLEIDNDKLWSLAETSHGVALNLLRALAERLRNGNSVIHRIHSLLREYEHSATVDPLTGLFNRRWLDTMLGRYLQRARSSRTPLAVAMIDVDQFKAFNDRYGHLAGDSVLQQVAQRLRDHLRPGDAIARYGGEELLAILPETGLVAAVNVAERLRAAVGERPVPIADAAQPSVTVSVGVAELTPADDAPGLVGAADTALYQAKANGRNRVEVNRRPQPVE